METTDPSRVPVPHRQAGWRRAVALACWSSLTLLIFGLSLAVGLVISFLRDPPSLALLEDYHPSLATILYTDQGEPFHSFYEQRRILLRLAAIPKQLQEAVLAVEDAHFYQHHGLSLRGIARALVANFLTGRRAQGGSTITQQLARRLFLTPEKSLTRKMKEALLALEIERRYSKGKILELYLNLVYFGHGAYGVEAAAQTYFQKSVGELTLSEEAMLAGLPSAPNRFSPILDPVRARGRRDHVLSRMVAEGYLTQEQAETTRRTWFTEGSFTRHATIAPYFVEHVRQQLEATYGAYILYNTGLKVYTTLNLQLQRAAEEALVGGLRGLDKARGYRPPTPQAVAARGRIGPYTPTPGEILPATVLRVTPQAVEVQLGRYRGEIALASLKWTRLAHPAAAFPAGGRILVRVLDADGQKQTARLALEQDPELEGAFLALGARDGAIQAMIGGYDFERSKFNRATQAKRQPGSAFKPFVYATAFDQGLTPSTILDDSPISFQTQVGGESVEWAPENFDREFHGPTTLRRALERSVNVVTVKLLEEVGIDPVIELAHQVGIKSDLRREVALALGVSEVSLLELVSAYGVFANEGVRAEPFAIRRVTDSQGRVLLEHQTQPQEVLRPETAYVLVNVMKGVIERGTGAQAKVLQRPLAGKTGTSSDATDVWFVGFSPTLVAGVWIGYDLKRSLGPAETGARLALPIWIKFMQKALAGTDSEDFSIPEGVVALPVDPQTGRPLPPGTAGAITEYFVEGTEPEVEEATVPPPAPSPPPPSVPPRVSETPPRPSDAPPRPSSAGPVPFTISPGPDPIVVPFPKKGDDR